MTKSKQEWEVEAQDFMDRLSILDLAILNSIVYHKIHEERQRVVETLKKLGIVDEDEGTITFSYNELFDSLEIR